MNTEDTTVKSYVTGFLFDKYRKNVLLIDKLKPEWQRGKLNGVGGKIEYGETPYDAMYREFTEEAGLFIPHWREFAKLSGDTYRVHFFTALYPWELSEAKSLTEEQLVIAPVAKLHELRIIDNLKWLIPLAADTNEYYYAKIEDHKTWTPAKLG